MGAGGEGEGGSTYDDLWMLANLIGPARPITTTQEAIDNAGFAVGRFEQALQGMRNVTTLGDSSKCLVCMSEYEEGEDMRALKCNHGFHQECIDKVCPYFLGLFEQRSWRSFYRVKRKIN